MTVLFEDTEIIVCLKPAGINSQGGNSDMVARLNSYFSENSSNAVAYPVHRLDRETAGIMVFAKNAKGAAELSKQVSDSKMKKHYFAVINGSPSEKSGVLKDLLFHDRQKNKTYTVKRYRKGVKDASLEYVTVCEADGLSLLDILLHTGRTHQIRVQFASRKLPLYGDGKYGGGNGKLALFAYKLEFVHPVTHKEMIFAASPDYSEYPWNKFKN